MTYTCSYLSPLGPLTMASNGEALIGLWFDGQQYFGSGLLGQHEERDGAVFAATRLWLDAYFRGERPATSPPLHLIGTPFQQQVWAELLTIPYGATATYGAIATSIARAAGRNSMSAQAVGGAVGHNPISIIVPCHRVVGADGRLTGYAGGLHRKEALLRLEQIALADPLTLR
ncbi:MAG: methylated-DNA--[protein]-cysteine S-methyltransferase [Bacteroidaceae bacterium]|nr:methylated-DNA--[protein]-cysteine S-methyltransferase [Bacteroidaceae bacterium]